MRNDLVDWQRVDENLGLVEPWWTWPCMDVIKTWDLGNKSWLETGAGLSSAWLRWKCKWVDSIEANYVWSQRAQQECAMFELTNGRFFDSELRDGIQEDLPLYFNQFPKDVKYDIISVDGIFRNQCLEWAIDHFKGRGGTLVVDNLDQDFVWISPAANELMAPYPCEIYCQPGHINHEGKPWNTRIYTIPA